MSVTRFASVLLLLVAACDFSPPPPKTKIVNAAPVPPKPPVKPPVATTPPANPTTVPPPVQTPPPPVDDVTPACLASATHMIDVSFATIPEDRRAAADRERARSVRAVAEECTRKKWSAEALNCIDTGTTFEAISKCDSFLPHDPAPGMQPEPQTDGGPNAKAETPPPPEAEVPEGAAKGSAAPAADEPKKRPVRRVPKKQP